MWEMNLQLVRIKCEASFMPGMKAAADTGESILQSCNILFMVLEESLLF